MKDFIREHKGLIIGIIAGISVMVIAVTCAVIFGGKDRVKPDDKGVTNAANMDIATINDSGDEQTKPDSETTGEEKQDITSETKSESTTGVVSTTEKPVTVPTGVKTLTDGNKKVYYPAALEEINQKYPVIVWANGTGCATDTYNGLLTNLAEGGYIVVADSSVMTADGTAQISSIDYIISKNKDSNSPFYGKVDETKIGATGHSQGGRSSVNAAQKDKRIKCIVSIAGASNSDEARGLTAPSLFLTGTADMVVVSSQWCKPSYDAVTGTAAYASLKGAGHTVCMTNPEKVSGYVISWFDAYLKNDSAAKVKFQTGGELSKDSAWQDFQCK